MIKLSTRKSVISIGAMLLLALTFATGVIDAQDAAEPTTQPNPPTAIPVPSITPAPAQAPVEIKVTSVTPLQLFAGQSGVLTVIGNNFTAATKVALVGVGDMAVSFVTPQRLQVAIPSDLAAGPYIIQVTDPVNLPDSQGSTSSFILNVIPPPAATVAPTLPNPTQVPTDIPGSPNLLVRSFFANPSTIKPGETVSFNVDVVNQGSRVAQGISVSVDAGGKFLPANGQSNIILPDIGVGGTFTFSLSVVAATDTTGGPQTVALTFGYRDFSGQAYTSKGNLTVNVNAEAQSSQITLARYLFDPNPVLPGQSVTITVLLTNTGNETAAQTLVQVATDGILLAGPQGNSFPVGDIEAGASASVSMPLIVSTSAKSGPQSQTVAITYLQDGESKNINGSMTIDVAKVDAPAPIMLVQSYSTGFDDLRPGQQFKLTLAVQNIGNDDATNMLVTFGSVESSGGGIDPTPGSTSSTTTTPSTTFTPINSGGTLSAGTVEAGGVSVTLEQDFIVSASVDSGVYSLPVTLRYQKSDGSTAQDRLSVGLIVMVPPQIRVTQSSELPTSANVGDAVSLALEISNRGQKQVNFSTATVMVDNGEVLQGNETFMGPLRNDDQTELSATIIPANEGPVTITVTFNYTDDLNHPQTIVETYTLDALPALPPPDFNGENPPDFGGIDQPPVEVPLTGRDLLGKILLGLLGLGS